MSGDILSPDYWEGWEIHTKGRMVASKCQKCGKFFDYISNYKVIKFCSNCQKEKAEQNRQKKKFMGGLPQ